MHRARARGNIDAERDAVTDDEADDEEPAAKALRLESESMAGVTGPAASAAPSGAADMPPGCEELGTKEIAMMRGLRFFMAQESQGLKTEIQTVGGKVTRLENRMDAQETEMKTFQARLTAVETGRAQQCATGGASSAASSAGVSTRAPTTASNVHLNNPYSLASRAAAEGVENYVPIKLRTRICIGGFEYLEGSIIADFLKTVFEDGAGNLKAGVRRYYPAGGNTSLAKVEFATNNDMWRFMTSMKGRKIESQLAEASRGGRLWHGIDKYDFEILDGKKIRFVSQKIEERLVAGRFVPDEATAKLVVNTDQDLGSIVLRPRHIPNNTTNQQPIKFVHRVRGSGTLATSEGYEQAASHFGIRLAEIVDEANELTR